jgi:NAD(P)-dependent dehydrogenase (short-subunit alcohol dehydrogenase family)
MMHKNIDSIFSLQDKLALITGGASPLGIDAASILASVGCRLMITSRSLDKAKAAANMLSEKYGVEAWAFRLDHTSEESLLDVKTRLIEAQLVPDILINNAGGGSGSSVSDLFQRSFADILNTINTNLTGTLFCCKVFGSLMAEKGYGKIINIASIAGIVGRDRSIYADTGMLGQPVDYAAAKAGVIGLTRDLAAYLADKGILVNAISPGGFTSAKRPHPENFEQRYSSRTALKRMGRDEVDLKGAILYLASSASDYVTGQNIVVDGGFTIFK